MVEGLGGETGGKKAVKPDTRWTLMPLRVSPSSRRTLFKLGQSRSQ
jgi:hypothetical protein